MRVGKEVREADRKLQLHPVVNLFPPMAEDEYEALKADLAANGQQEAIWLHDGRVIDGRNRLRACTELGIEPKTKEWDGTGSPVKFVVSVNLHRRHLTGWQKAAVGVEVEARLAEEAKERMRQGGGDKKSAKAKESGKEKVPDPMAGQARDQAAAAVGTNPRYLGDAKAVKEADPELFEKVRAGTVTGKAALAEVRRRQKKAEREAVEAELAAQAGGSDRFRVDCADCVQWFNAQPPDSVHLVFGSPPYEDARLYLEDGRDPGIALGTEQWVAWMVEVYQAALRCCTGLVAFVVGGRTKDYSWSGLPHLLAADLLRAGVCLRPTLVYHRVGIPGSGGPDWLRTDHEFVVCATRGGPLPWSDNTAMGGPPKFEPGGDPTHRQQDGARVNGNGYATMSDRNNQGPHRARRRGGRAYTPPEIANPGSVIRCKVGGGNMGDDLCHENEAPFPEELVEFFVRSFCPPNGTVCDPFSGSGTTGAVAVRHGRRFVGCDVRESQVRLSRQRIGKTTINEQPPKEGEA
jgi:hypothetical protein